MKGSDTMNFKKKSSSTWLLISAFLLFAAASVCGCGGSSNSISKVYDSDLDLPSMFDIRATSEFQNMIDELEKEGVWDKVESFTFYNVYEYITPEQLEEMLKEIPEELHQYFITQNRLIYDELVSFYNSGAILTLFHPDDDAIQQTFAFLSSVSADVSMLDIEPDVEICAITKQTANGAVINSLNTVSLDCIFTYIIPDISTLVSTDENSSPDDVEKEYIDMQVERWKRYYYWLADLKDKAQENARSASAIIAASAKDNNIVNVSRVVSGTYDWSYSNMKNWDKVDIDQQNAKDYIKTNDREIMYGGSRKNVLDYQIYSVHSFTDHNDYFVISSNLYSSPQNVETKAKCYFPFVSYGYTWFKGVRGYTRGLTNRISFAGERVSTSMPDGVSKGAPYRENFTWSNEGMVTGQNFGAFEGVNFTKEISLDAANLTVENISDTSSAALYVSFDRPTEASSEWSGFTAYNASARDCLLPTIAVLKVSESEWKKGYDSSTLVLSGGVEEGETAKNYYYRNNYEKLYETPRIDVAFSKNFSLTVKNPNPPMHSTVHQRNFAFNKHGDMIDASIKVYSESDWHLVLESTASNWVILDKTSGTATGPEGEWVHFSVPENTTGSGRFAKIMLITSPYNDKTKTEATIVDLFQSNNEGFSAD